MKLELSALDYIQTVVKTAQLVGIDSIIIEPEIVRGMDDAQTVVLFQNEDVPEFAFGSIGLNRTDVFITRLEIVKTQEGFKVEATIDEEKGFVRSLVMKAKGTKIDYRCANPATVKAPKIINDDMIAEVQLTPEAVVLLQKGVAAMGNAEMVAITSNNEGISFSLEDLNCDTFDHTFGEVIAPRFSYKYPVKTLLAMFKKDAEGTFHVGQKGMLRIIIDGIGVYVLPKV